MTHASDDFEFSSVQQALSYLMANCERQQRSLKLALDSLPVLNPVPSATATLAAQSNGSLPARPPLNTRARATSAILVDVAVLKAVRRAAKLSAQLDAAIDTILKPLAP
jgi:hypothetical protein